MNPEIAVWNGAQWIGGGDEGIVFFSRYQLIFEMKYSLYIRKLIDPLFRKNRPPYSG